MLPMILPRCLVLLLLLAHSSLATSTTCLRQGIAGIGVYIDHRDRFMVATSCSEEQSKVVAQGILKLDDPLQAKVQLNQATSASEKGKFWKIITSDSPVAKQMSTTVFEQLKSLIGETDVIVACTIATPQLSYAQRDVVRSAANAAFGYDDIMIWTDSFVAMQAPENRPKGELLLAIVPSCTTYVFTEDDDGVVPLSTLDVIPSPFDHSRAFKHGTPKAIIYVHDDVEDCFDHETQLNGIPIRREHESVIVRSAAIISSYSIPAEPMTILPLSLNVVLHGSHSYTLLKQFDLLPKHANVTLTTVHDNQKSVTIEIVEGERPRAGDDLPFAKLALDNLPSAPARTLQIQVSVSVNRYSNQVKLEVVELKSGSRAEHVVERGVLLYSKGVLEGHEKAVQDHLEQDRDLEKSFNWVAEEQKYPHAVRLFDAGYKPPIVHEGLRR